MPGPYPSFFLAPDEITGPDAGLTPLQRFGGYAKLNNDPVTNPNTEVDAEEQNKLRQAVAEICTYIRENNTPVMPTPKLYWRLHTTQADTFADRMAALPGAYAQYYSDVPIMVLWTLPALQVTLIDTVATKLAALGIPVFYGISIGPPSATVGWVEQDWQAQANTLQQLRDIVGARWTIKHVQFDEENYFSGAFAGQPTAAYLASHSQTQAQLKTAAQPFLDKVKEMARAGFVPYMYPCGPTDMLTPLITEAAIGTACLSDEITFSNSRLQRKDRAAYANYLGGNAARWNQMRVENPGCTIVTAGTDDLVKRYGRLYRETIGGVPGYLQASERPGWLYMSDWPQYFPQVGTQAYYDGTVNDTTNDVKLGGYIEPSTIKIDAAMAWGSDVPTPGIVFDTWRLPANAVDNSKPPQADGFHVTGTTDCRMFQLSRTDVIASAHDFTVKPPPMLLPTTTAVTDHGFIMSVGRVWALVWDAVADQIQLRTLATVGSHTFVVENAPAKGVRKVYVLSYQHSTKTWRVNGLDFNTTNAWTGGTAVLRFGGSFDLPTGNTVMGYDGLIFKSGEDWAYHDRFFTAAEQTKLLTGIYPRGLKT